jgi:hypothetical protein
MDLKRHSFSKALTCAPFSKKTFPARSLERQNFQATFKAHLVQVRNERHTQIERDQGAASGFLDYNH